jgi:flagellin
MPITIGSNIASLKAQRQLSKGTAELSKTYERLSSGQRINRAADDAAGLAISESLKSDKRVFNQGIRNFNDGISLLNIADGAIENLSNITIRLKELAEQSANGTYGVQQRKSLDAEAQALSKEYLRIAQSTKFNGKYLFDGSFGEGLRLQGGFGTDGAIQSNLGGALGTATFGASTSYDTERFCSNALSFGDLNGDGNLDMVTAGSAGKARVRLGTGDGGFGAAVTYAMESNISYALSLGDLNGDGILDLVTAGNGITDGRATVRLGNGDGSFGTAVSYATESNGSTALSLGDLNGDGILDLATAGYQSTSGRTTIRLGKGDGTFGTAVSYTAEIFGSHALVLGDLNHDGILDLVTAGTADSSHHNVGAATIRIGNGDGSFGAASTYIATDFDNASYSVTLGDLNGDGMLDMVMGGGYSGSGWTSTMLGRGDGSFGAGITAPAELIIANELSLGDMNGDGILDLVTAGYDSSYAGEATVRIGNGDGSFKAGISYLTETIGSYALSIGDLNGDGVLDIATGGYGPGNGKATVRLGNSTFGVSPLLKFDLTTLAGARQALPQFDKALGRLSSQRGTIGAFQSRITVGANVLRASSENYAAAESRIRDADIANESSQLVRLNILQQAASAVLGQANLQPQLALSLFRN